MGFTLYDIANGLNAYLIGNGVDMNSMQTESVDEYIIENYDTTRLIGFRTTKACE